MLKASAGLCADWPDLATVRFLSFFSVCRRVREAVGEASGPVQPIGVDGSWEAGKLATEAHRQPGARSCPADGPI